MEIYILDSTLRRYLIVDKFESLIWTERFSAYGEFELVLHSTFENRRRLIAGVRLAMNESYRVMTIETVTNNTDDDGREVLVVKGYSLEKLLDDRIAKKSMSNLTVEPKWIITGTPGTIIRYIFEEICVFGRLSLGDKLPFVTPNSWLAWGEDKVWESMGLTEYWENSGLGWEDQGSTDQPFNSSGTIIPKDTIPESAEIITVALEVQTVYKAIKDLCDLYDLGFRMVRNLDTSNVYFNVYSGIDRTTSQNDTDAVVFSPSLDNLQNTSELTTIADYKNVAYVFSPVGFKIVYGLDVNPNTSGFRRHVLLVKADDITDTNPAIASALMIQKGTEELSKYRSFSAFDGEINQKSVYKYQVHYNLGDLVEMHNVDGVVNRMRVTEQIFVSDKEGERSYPTLSLNQFITPDAWLAWDNNSVWADGGPTEYWRDA